MSKKYRQSKAGLSQRNRWLKGLDPDYVRIDDHSFEELVAFSAEYSSFLNFYNSRNVLDGNWKELFTADLTVILSFIITQDISRFKINYKRYEVLIETTGINNTELLISYYRSLIHSIVEMASLFHFWTLELKTYTDMQSAFYDELQHAVNDLKKNYQQLRAFSKGAARKEGIEAELDVVFVKNTNLVMKDDPVADTSIYAGESIGERVKHAGGALKSIFDSFYDTLTYFKAIAPRYLEESLKHNDHAPQIGLLFAFLKLYKKAQGSINEIKGRHLDFYYREVLQQEPRAAIPDKVNVCLQLSEETDSYLLRKGTRFLADKDEDGNERVYEANNFIVLNHADIQELRTLYKSKNKYVEVGCTEKLVSGIYEAKITGEAVEADDGEARAWPTLGEDQVGVSNVGRTMRDASLGFAVASPALQLNEGERDVSLEFTFSKESFSAFKDQIQEIADNTDTTFAEVFFKAFGQAFHLSVTSEEGWMHIQKYGVECPSLKDETIETDSIVVNFRLSYGDPPFIGHDPEIHGSEFDSQWPVARLAINKDSFIYPYSLLSCLVLYEVGIHAQVNEVRDIIVYNNLGQLSLDEPFQPFGPTPKKGSYLLIGSEEVVNKAVQDITLTLEWADLPDEEGGFYDYYRGYEGYGIDNTSFKVDFSLLKEGKWEYPKKEEDRNYFLFETEGQQRSSAPHPFGKLARSTTYSTISLEEFKLSPNYDKNEEPLSYNKTTKAGFIKFELQGDDILFGHKKYPFLISEVFLENAKIKKERNKKEIPNEPYTPLLNSIRVGYTDYKSIKFITEKGIKDESRAGEAYHIMPFGFSKQVYPSEDNDPVYLVPNVKERGSLFIGLKGLEPPTSLTLYFQIKGKNVASFEDTSSDVSWHYLVNNKWRKLAPSEILSDSTENLLRSGVVNLELPQSIAKGNTILEDDLHWIKVTGSKNIEMIGDTVSIQTQAATLSWVPDSSTDTHLHTFLPAESITSLEKPVSEIAAVFQPEPSLGGKSKENEKQMYTRISERLRHKNRAIVSRDYEQLILDKFPDIYKVNCLQSTSTYVDVDPGKVLITVIPSFKYSAKFLVLPMANVSVLRNIKEYVQSLASPFVQVEVRNPYYERVRVVCSVRFAEGLNNGQTIKSLNHDLKQYLSPWFYDYDRDIRFGREINISDISGFIQSKDYVDFVTKLSLLKVSEYEDEKYMLSDTARREIRRSSKRGEQIQEEITPSKPWSVLVSAMRHHIEILSKEEVILAEQTGIDDLEIGTSFIID
ncbi:MAG: hypothetical protein FH748_15060 [Balneolaceae bacterium]|nr:hypothetical protein [Balneolaceae bacterium]